MNKFKKQIANFNANELNSEAKRLKNELKKANLDKITGKAKNLRAVFNLRKQLSIVLSKVNLTK